MIVGHVGIAFGARALFRDEPLPWLLAATLAPDFLDFAYAAAGVCNVYGVWSHSLPAVAVTAIVFGALAFAVTRSRATAFLVGVLVLAHLPPDYITGQKMLWPHGPIIGFYLYQRPLRDFAIEAPIVVLGWAMLRRDAAAHWWARNVATLAALILFQAAMDAAIRPDKSLKPNSCKGVERTASAVRGLP